MVSKEVEKLLLKVQKPGRYVGGELNAVVKNKKDVDVRFAFCFPDTYEVGMSHLGMKILYSLFNSIPYIWCERVFAPWIDMEEEMIKIIFRFMHLRAATLYRILILSVLHCSMSLVLQMCSICLSFRVCRLNPVSVQV